MSFHFQMPLGESCGNNHSRDNVPCGTCGNQFRTKGQLKTHRQICGKNVKKQTQKLQTSKDKKPVTIHKCSSCKSGFLNKDALNRHRQTHHEKMHKCPCGRAFSRNRTLLAHQSNVSKDPPYKCTLCGMEFELIVLRPKGVFGK